VFSRETTLFLFILSAPQHKQNDIKKVVLIVSKFKSIVQIKMKYLIWVVVIGSKGKKDMREYNSVNKK
jgi:hypothetical protein